jgi:hypothetical protein
MERILMVGTSREASDLGWIHGNRDHPSGTSEVRFIAILRREAAVFYGTEPSSLMDQDASSLFLREYVGTGPRRKLRGLFYI